VNPQFPLYIVSKSRWEHNRRLTSRALEKMRVPYRIVVEAEQRECYAEVIDPAKILVLDPAYQRDYDTCDDLGDTKSKGPGPARNFVWDHAIGEGHAWHWVLDDNIRAFYRLNNNLKNPVGDGTVFCCMEDFVLRYENVVMAGPQYEMFCPRKVKVPPFVPNTRIYSCNLIRNDIPYRWRGRYNEDTDLSLRILKDGLCTIQFNAFLQHKMTTQLIEGGCTKEFYEKEGTEPKSRMIVDLHPDVARLTWKFHRCHHEIDYRQFRINHLHKKPDLEVAEGIAEYGMALKPVNGIKLKRNVRPATLASIFDATGTIDLTNYLRLCQKHRPELDVEAARTAATQLIQLQQNPKKASENPEAEVERRWYESIRKGQPDYSVYDDNLFLSNLWACWIVYSRGYLNGIRKLSSTFGEIGSVADLGCGFGYTTAALKEMFPKAEVFGTNLPDTLQFQVASEIGQQRGFAVVPDARGRKADLIFASEYFEHIESPVEHLQEIIDQTGGRFMVIANAFGARATGHFNHYRHEGRTIMNKQIGRVFNRTLRLAGYRAVKTKFWNNRPAIWQKAS
jgi:SAM-dependent methyltransferase